jgi:hypothetical protein
LTNAVVLTENLIEEGSNAVDVLVADLNEDAAAFMQ